MLAGLLSVATVSAQPFQPKSSYQYGWQGAGNYITGKQLKEVEVRIRSQMPAEPENSPAYQKALCSIELAKWTYREVNTKGITEHLVATALQQSAQAQAGVVPPQSETLPGTPRQYQAAWARLEELKQQPGSQCAIKALSCADVALLGLEYETKEGYGRHRNHGIYFRDQAENLLNQADSQAQACAAEESQPAPPPVQTVSLDTDALFAFDSAKLTAAGQRRIDEFVRQLPKFSHGIDHINIVGHTDRIGSDAYNQRLSEQRAEAVKSALLQRVPKLADVVGTAGRGKAEPIVDCPGSKATAALKSCLQPNRRVTVTVTGIAQ